MRPRLAAVLVSLSVALAATACAGSDELVIYSGRGESLVGPLLDRFAEQTGIPIAVRYGDSAELALLLAQEGSETAADVFYAQNPGAVAFLGEQGRLATLPSELLDEVPEVFRSDRDRWVGVTGRQRVLVYDSSEVTEADLPASVFELTDERFRGRVAVAPLNGSFQDFVSAMRIAVGDERTLEWLQGLVANDVRAYPNNNAIVEAVGRGEVDMGLVNHYYNFRFLEEDPELPSRNYRFGGGDLGSLVIPSTVSILQGTDLPDEAQRFVEYLLSDDAQRYFREQTFEYPLAGDIEADPDLPQLTDADLPEVDLDQLGSELRGTTELIEQSGLTD